MMEKQQQYFFSREVRRIFGVSETTICRMEAEGLITPRRDQQNRKVYTRRDLERIRTILDLSRELGVNWAGVEVILHMRDQMIDLQRQIDEIFTHLHRQMEQTLEQRPEDTRERLPRIEIIRILDDQE